MRDAGAPEPRTVAAPPPKQVDTALRTPAQKARYARARARALTWAKQLIAKDGLGRQLKVVNRDATQTTVDVLGALRQKLAKVAGK